MDIYRYFHPHHNPRLFSTPLRQQELSELEQASSELRKALERARLRTERGTPSRILPSHFDDLLKAVKFIESSLQTLCDAHEGDALEILKELVMERRGLRGWETWARIVTEQLASEHSITTKSQSTVHDSRAEHESLTESAVHEEILPFAPKEDVVREQSHGDNNNYEQTRVAGIAAPVHNTREGVGHQIPHIITSPPAQSLTAHLQQNRIHQNHDSTRVVRPEENSPQ